MKRISLILSFILFIALCASVSFWLLQFMKPEVRHIVAPAKAKPVADIASVAGLFGGAATVNTNYQLKGIVMANPASQSGAILVLDGQPAQAFNINGEVNPGVKLVEVHPDYIVLSDKGVNRRIDLPKESKGLGLSEMPLPRYPNGPAAAPATRTPDLNQINRNLRARGMQPFPAEPLRPNSVPAATPPEPAMSGNN